MAKAWSYWYPDLLPHVPGCPNPLADQELRRAAQEFFKESRAWQDTLPLISITAAQSAVTVTFADAGQELVRVEHATYDGIALGVTTSDALDAAYSDDWTIHTGTPSHVYQVTPGVVRLYPIPVANSVAGLKLRAAIRPSDTATGLADEMAVKYRGDIPTGAKSRLMLYPNKPWSNPSVALLMAADFEAAISKARLAAARSFGRGRIAAKPTWA